MRCTRVRTVAQTAQGSYWLKLKRGETRSGTHVDRNISTIGLGDSQCEDEQCIVLATEAGHVGQLALKFVYEMFWK